MHSMKWNETLSSFAINLSYNDIEAKFAHRDLIYNMTVTNAFIPNNIKTQHSKLFALSPPGILHFKLYLLSRHFVVQSITHQAHDFHDESAR